MPGSPHLLPSGTVTETLEARTVVITILQIRKLRFLTQSLNNLSKVTKTQWGVKSLSQGQQLLRGRSGYFHPHQHPLTTALQREQRAGPFIHLMFMEHRLSAWMISISCSCSMASAVNQTHKISAHREFTFSWTWLAWTFPKALFSPNLPLPLLVLLIPYPLKS